MGASRQNLIENAENVLRCWPVTSDTSENMGWWISATSIFMINHRFFIHPRHTMYNFICRIRHDARMSTRPCMRKYGPNLPSTMHLGLQPDVTVFILSAVFLCLDAFTCSFQSPFSGLHTASLMGRELWTQGFTKWTYMNVNLYMPSHRWIQVPINILNAADVEVGFHVWVGFGLCSGSQEKLLA